VTSTSRSLAGTVASPDTKTASHAKRDGWVVTIGIFKLVKAVLLIAVAAGLLRIFEAGTARTITECIEALRIDPQNRIVQWVAEHLFGIHRRHLPLMAVGTVLYAVVFATEGVGLLLGKHWAEYLTIGVTISFIPIEVFELVQHVNVLKAVTIVVNVAIVIYLIWKVRSHRKEAHA
jgi:uncharacterized membrane protein (DUF2068 family)